MALFTLAGCGGGATGGASGGGGGVPDPLRIGVIPAEDTQNVTEAFEPVADFVGKKLDTNAELYTATDYSGIIEAMRSGEAEVAWLGPEDKYFPAAESYRLKRIAPDRRVTVTNAFDHAELSLSISYTPAFDAFVVRAPREARRID